MLKGDNKILYVLFGAKEIICNDNNIKIILEGLYDLGYTVIFRGRLWDGAWALEVLRQ